MNTSPLGGHHPDTSINLKGIEQNNWFSFGIDMIAPPTERRDTVWAKQHSVVLATRAKPDQDAVYHRTTKVTDPTLSPNVTGNTNPAVVQRTAKGSLTHKNQVATSELYRRAKPPH